MIDKPSSIWTPRGVYFAPAEQLDDDIAEPTDPRICASPTIQQCFQAISPNVKQFFGSRLKRTGKDYIEFTVYSPDIRDKLVIKPRTLTSNRWVHDAHMTDEHWILDSVQMNNMGRIKIYDTFGDKIRYKLYNDNNSDDNNYIEPATVKYEWINKKAIRKW